MAAVLSVLHSRPGVLLITVKDGLTDSSRVLASVGESVRSTTTTLCLRSAAFFAPSTNPSQFVLPSVIAITSVG